MLITFFLGPFGEEFGWRGYLLPRLLKSLSVVPTVLVVGAIWATWHWPLLYQSFLEAPGRELVTTIAGVMYMSVVIGAVYLRTGSLLLAMLLHWNINTVADISGRVFPGLPDRSDDLLRWCGIGAGVLVAALTIPSLLLVERTRIGPASAETPDRG
jgi:membrane protease YdiL (CAAX protease family)